MTKSLALDSLQIENFRAFKSLRIDRLARVNLIVGKNNVGKSSLLEALWLFAENGSPEIMLKILSARNESPENGNAFFNGNQVQTAQERFLSLRFLFHGRTDVREYVSGLRIGSLNDLGHQIMSFAGWYGYRDAETDSSQYAVKLTHLKPEESSLDKKLGLVVQFGTDNADIYSTQDFVNRPIISHSRQRVIKNIFIKADDLKITEIDPIWDSLLLLDTADNIVKGLQLLAPTVERTNMLRFANNGRIPFVKLTGFDEPVALKSMGDGMNHLFGLTVALVRGKDGFVLIDEIESGLHYSVMPKVWKLVFEMARELNVQVFATTHSWDCIQAFQAAAEEHYDEDAQLISLRANPKDTGEVAAVLFAGERLKHVAQDPIEVR